MNNSQTDESFTQSLDRKMRLKELLDEGQDLERDIANQESVETLEAIKRMIKRSDEIINEGAPKDRLEHTTEVVMDTHVLKMNHELVSKVIQQNMEFNENIYQNAINSVVNTGNSVDWTALAKVACTVARTAHVQSTMLGAIEKELKAPVVKERQQRRAANIAAEKRPESVNELKRQDKGAERVNLIYKQLGQLFEANNNQPIPFYKLIIDPKCFMSTIENAFQLSFLARDGAIGVETGEDGHPEVRLVRAAEQKIQMDTSQWICSIDMKKWKDMIKFYKIESPMLQIKLDAMDIDEEEDSD